MSYMTSMVDLLDSYACCLSPVNIFIIRFNLFVITVSHILYIWYLGDYSSWCCWAAPHGHLYKWLFVFPNNRSYLRCIFFGYFVIYLSIWFWRFWIFQIVFGPRRKIRYPFEIWPHRQFLQKRNGYLSPPPIPYHLCFARYPYRMVFFPWAPFCLRRRYHYVRFR